jgi:hypothetical protein
MVHHTDTARTDEIARIAYAIWEKEGRPGGRYHDHWAKAKQLLKEGRAYSEYPEARVEGDRCEKLDPAAKSRDSISATATEEAAQPDLRDLAAYGFGSVPERRQYSGGDAGNS